MFNGTTILADGIRLVCEVEGIDIDSLALQKINTYYETLISKIGESDGKKEEFEHRPYALPAFADKIRR